MASAVGFSRIEIELFVHRDVGERDIRSTDLGLGLAVAVHVDHNVEVVTVEVAEVVIEVGGELGRGWSGAGPLPMPAVGQAGVGAGGGRLGHDAVFGDEFHVTTRRTVNGLVMSISNVASVSGPMSRMSVLPAECPQADCQGVRWNVHRP